MFFITLFKFIFISIYHWLFDLCFWNIFKFSSFSFSNCFGSNYK